jgi:uncharacterized protein (DUF58 family)
MTPILALRGRLIAASGALFVGAGAIHRDAWPLVGLGVLTIAALCTSYLWYFPAAIYLRRHKVELAWWVPPGDQPGGALTADIPFLLHLALRNRGQRPLRVVEARIFASSAIQVPQAVATVVAPGHEVELGVALRASACGHWVLHGALVKLADALGLFELRAYFPSPIGLKVFPKLAGPRAGQVVIRPQFGALHERVGVHTIRRRGLAGELREIREHALGDPFKFIAWKATARKRQLMVRELESEIVVTHQLLVDMAGTMRGGEPGQSKLDYAIETASALARVALERGDRVGLITFDSRVYAQLKPGEGRPHFLKVIDRLLDTKNVVDPDLTELTDGELVATVARYLLHQEGLDFRLPRAPDRRDPAWAKLAAGPAGELYDLLGLGQVVGGMVKTRGRSELPRPGAGKRAGGKKGPRAAAAPDEPPTSGYWSRVPTDTGNPDMARMRLFCRLRGIELPYRQLHEPGKRAGGLADALRRAASSERSQLVVLFSDLEGVVDDEQACLRAVSLARQRHHRLFVVAPFGPAFAPAPLTPVGDRVAEVMGEEAQRRLDHARRVLQRQGVPVIVAGPTDSPSSLARRMVRGRPQRHAS